MRARVADQHVRLARQGRDVDEEVRRHVIHCTAAQHVRCVYACEGGGALPPTTRHAPPIISHELPQHVLLFLLSISGEV